MKSIAATPWVPADHVIVKKTLTDSLLLSKIRKQLPLKADLKSYETLSSFVTIRDYNPNEESKEESKEYSPKKEKKDIVEEYSSPMRTRGQEKKNIEKEKKLKDALAKETNKGSEAGSGGKEGGKGSDASDVRVEWSDGSYATVGRMCGRLLR